MSFSRIRLTRFATGVLAIVCVLLFLSYGVALVRNGTNLIDSDWAGELLLAREMVTSGQFFPDTWMYSTEVRTLCANLLLAPFYALTGDLLLTSTLAIVFSTLLFCASMLFVARSLRLSWGYSLFALALLLLPWSKEYATMMFYQAFYTPLCTGALFAVGLMLHAQNTTTHKALIFRLFAGLIALLQSMMGFRLPLQIYIPFFLAALLLYLLRQKKPFHPATLREVLPSALLLLCSFVGLFINRFVLTQVLSVARFSHLRVSMDVLPNLMRVFKHVLAFFGLENGFNPQKIADLLGLFKLTLFLLFLLVASISLLRWILRRGAQRSDIAFIAATALISLLLLLGVSIFTTLDFHPRYLILSLLFLPFVLAFALSCCTLWPVRGGGLLFGALLCLSCASTTMNTTLARTDNTPRMGALEYLAQNGPHAGIARIWNSGVSEVLSQGKLSLLSFNENFTTAPYFWLNRASLYTIDTLPRDMFLLLPKWEMPYMPEGSLDGTLLYDDGEYAAFHIDARTFFDTPLPDDALCVQDDGSVLLSCPPPLLGNVTLRIALSMPNNTSSVFITTALQPSGQSFLPNENGEVILSLCTETLVQRNAFYVHVQCEVPFTVTAASFDL